MTARIEIAVVSLPAMILLAAIDVTSASLNSSGFSLWTSKSLGRMSLHRSRLRSQSWVGGAGGEERLPNAKS
jgi:hypothetical protein